MMPMQRVPTGMPGLDALLYGGFLDSDAVLVAGAPGTGKSTLGMQYLFEGIRRYDEPGLFITFEEFPQQIYRDAMNFGWDFRRLEEENKLKVLFTSPELMNQDIRRHEGIFPEMIREIGAKRVVVDSITHFQHLAADGGELREIIYGLINALKREGLTPLLLRELMESERLGGREEEYTADAVLYLTMERVKDQRMRFLEVLKSRGSRHVAAKSLFYISDQGITVIPPFQEAFFRYQEASSIGIPDLDGLMGGGIPGGAFYLFELSPELHQEILELNLITETQQAQDSLFELTTTTTRLQRLASAAQCYGMSQELQTALDSGCIHILPLAGTETAPKGVVQEAMALIEQGFQQLDRAHRGRILLDFTRLSTTLGDRSLDALLSRVQEIITRYHGVCVGMVNPHAIPAITRERLAMEADGIVRMWKEGNYTYIQVAKTVNAVLTPVLSLMETNNPPYLKVIQ